MSVTIKDIALETGLSWPTVSRILNGKGHLFKKDTRDRVIKKAKELGYVPNSAARGIKTNQTYHIGALLLNDPKSPLHYPASFEILQGINQALEQAGYVLSMIRIKDIHEDDQEQSRVFREKMLDGIICLDALPENLVQHVKKLIPRCIWLDANHQESHFCVYRDEQIVGEIAAMQMIKLGYPKIKFLTSDSKPRDYAPHFSTPSRWRGIQNACLKMKVNVTHVPIPHWTQTMSGQSINELWDESAGLILSGPHDAVRLMQVAHQHHLPVGHHIGIASCDMTEDFRLASPQLAHVSNNRYDLGLQAGTMMLELLTNPKSKCPSVTTSGQWFAGSTALGPA